MEVTDGRWSGVHSRLSLKPGGVARALAGTSCVPKGSWIRCDGCGLVLVLLVLLLADADPAHPHHPISL